MKYLNTSSAKTFEKLIDGLREPGDARRMGSNSASAFMAVHVDYLAEEGGTRFYSVAHYYESNGDLCADPDVQFAVRTIEPLGLIVWPYAIQQPFGFRELATFEGGEPKSYRPKGQADLVRFCDTWLKNIRQQQNL